MSMTFIEHADALGRFDEMMERVGQGENFIITRDGKPLCYFVDAEFKIPDEPPSPATIR